VTAANPYEKMLEDKIFTASKEELTLMLYEGAIKFCNQAIVAMEKKDYEKTNQLIQRVQDIIREFQMTLKFEYAIAKQFNDMYNYMHNRLLEANMKQSMDILNEVLELFRSFRDTWKQAMVLARKEKK
jgi:flagellar protein FliS